VPVVPSPDSLDCLHLLPEGGPVLAMAVVSRGVLCVRLLAVRGGVPPSGALLAEVPGGLWSLVDSRVPGRCVEVSSDLPPSGLGLPFGMALRLAVARLSARLARSGADPLSPSEEALLSSVPSVLEREGLRLLAMRVMGS
jgi:hypothetical protein